MGFGVSSSASFFGDYNRPWDPGQKKASREFCWRGAKHSLQSMLHTQSVLHEKMLTLVKIRVSIRKLFVPGEILTRSS
jgi:hypothetical protein